MTETPPKLLFTPFNCLNLVSIIENVLLPTHEISSIINNSTLFNSSLIVFAISDDNSGI